MNQSFAAHDGAATAQAVSSKEAAIAFIVGFLIFKLGEWGIDILRRAHPHRQRTRLHQKTD